MKSKRILSLFNLTLEVLAIAILSSCGNGACPPNGPTGSSTLQISPTTINLTVAEPLQTLTLTNVPTTGTPGGLITGISASFPFPLELVSTTCGNTLVIGASCKYIVRYIGGTQAGESALPFTFISSGSSTTESVAVIWENNPAIYPWAWEGGESQTYPYSPVYGIKGISDNANTPGGLGFGSSWSDDSGLWLFGGWNNSFQSTNAVWRYSLINKQWTWMSGESSVNSAGIYGTKEVPNINNTPGSRTKATIWYDKSRKIVWLFGGGGTSSAQQYNDLWKYNLITNEWTWISGESTVNATANYGIKGVASTSNVPGAMYGAGGWLDESGNLWLYGGVRNSPAPSYNSALWKYNVANNNWTWISGESMPDTPPQYGTLGTPCASSICQPGPRANGSTWSSNGYFYVFSGYTSYNNGSLFSDLWRYNPQTDQWTWINGSQAAGYNGCTYCNWGIQGYESAGNMNSSRAYASIAVESNGNVWILGGEPAVFNTYLSNDLWRYNSQTNQWLWSSGSDTNGGAGFPGLTSVYGTLGVASLSNYPGSREASFAWIGADGNLWLYGGYGKLDTDWPMLGDLWSYKIH